MKNVFPSKTTPLHDFQLLNPKAYLFRLLQCCAHIFQLCWSPKVLVIENCLSVVNHVAVFLPRQDSGGLHMFHTALLEENLLFCVRKIALEDCDEAKRDPVKKLA